MGPIFHYYKKKIDAYIGMETKVIKLYSKIELVFNYNAVP